MKVSGFGQKLSAFEAGLRTRPAASVAAVTAVLFIVTGALTGASLWRPFEFADDLMWEYAPHLYYILKLPAEGRWLVEWWRSLLGVWPRPLEFQLILALWCGTVALFSRMWIGPDRPRLMLLAALAMAACPPALNMLQWLHTSMPIMAALFAATLMSAMAKDEPGELRAAALGALVTAVSYQSFTIVYAGGLAAAATLSALRSEATPQQLVIRLAKLGAALAAGVIGGMLISYASNALAFGHFGIKIDSWRLDDEPDKRSWAISLHSLSQTMTLLAEQTLGAAPALFGVVMVLLGLRAGRETPGRAALLAWLALGVILAVAASCFLFPLVSGVAIQLERNGVPFWIMIVAGILAWLGPRQDRRHMIAAAVMLGLLAVTGLIGGALPFAGYSKYQGQDAAAMERLTRDFRKAIPTPGDADVTFVIGQTPLKAYINGPLIHLQPWWMQVLLEHTFTLNKLAPRPIYCSSIEGLDEDPCYDILIPYNAPELDAMPVYPNPGYIRRLGDKVIVKLGPAHIPPAAEDQ